MPLSLWTKSEVLMNGTIPISMYRSTRSRLLVTVGDVPGPMIKGCISFASEANCDDGLPHTLEHLIFMGSEKYPFKGVLDIVANRCLASGTNAWTCQDVTGYTLNTVGSEGFFKVLPVYLDHVLSPTLSDSSFATEVHHINGEGEDSGVIYNEMQAIETKMANMMRRKRLELLYPPNNPYRDDVGGRLKNLRESCSPDKVRNFHEKFYHLSNMVITVCGQLSHERLLKVVEATEEQHLPRIPATFQRPFLSFRLTPPSESIVQRVICPSDDESKGMVEITWFAYKPADFEQKAAVRVLCDYLSNTPVSPLQREFVHVDDPLSSQVAFSVNQQTTCVINLTFSGVPSDRLDEVRDRFMDKIVAKHLGDKAWDMERMGFVIKQAGVSEMREMEKQTDMKLFFHMFGHQVYDDDVEHFKARVNELELIRRLSSEPSSFWSHLVDKYFTKPHVAVIGVPSKEMVVQISQEEKVRLERQRETLGSDGMKECGAKIRKAIEENSRQPDESLLKELVVEKLEAFNRFPMDVRSNIDGSTDTDDSSCSRQTAKFLEQFPFPTTVHSCPTRFIELFFMLDSGGLTAEQRAWLLLYTELLFQTPSLIEGELKGAEDVAKLYTKDLVYQAMQIGICDFFDGFVVLRIVVDAEAGLPNLAKWAEIFTCGVVFEAERVKQCAKKLRSRAHEKKRDGTSVVTVAMASILYQQNSNAHLYNEFLLEKFHENIEELCDAHPQDVVNRLEQLRSALFSRGVNAHFVCNVDLIDSKSFDPQQWSFVEKRFGRAEKFDTSPGKSLKSTFIPQQTVISVGGSESSFLYQASVMNCGWMSKELVPTMLFAQYLSQHEGPLWCGIRGAGLAYVVKLCVKVEQRTISLSLSRCTQPALAYEQAKRIVDEVLKTGTLVEPEFQAAKRSLVAELMKREETVSDAAELSVIGQIAGLPLDYRRNLCEYVWNASLEDTFRLGSVGVANLLESYALVIAAPPSKMSEIKSAFTEIQEFTISSLNFVPQSFTL